MNEIQLTDDAKEDIRDGSAFYESKQKGLGHDFLDKIEEALQRIEENPEQFPKIYKEVRKTLTGRFPFKILFIVKSLKIIVFAVFHSSRNPNKWKERIGE